MPTRRAFLATIAGATVASSPATGQFGGEDDEATPQATDPWAPKPEHVSLEYDEATLKKYRPRLVTRSLEIKPSYLYSWVASSNEFDTDVACYWCWYEGQISDVKPASHRGDREPIQVYFNPDSGEVKEVVVDGYHYFCARYRDDAVPTQDGDEYRPTFTVADDYHFYYAGGSAGTDVELANMTDQYPNWVKNGWGVHQRSVLVPWQVAGADGRTDWWPDDVGTLSFEAFLRRVWLGAGLYGAKNADRDALAVSGFF